MFLETEIWIGLAGGCAAEALQWYHMRKELYKGVPDWAKSQQFSF